MTTEGERGEEGYIGKLGIRHTHYYVCLAVQSCPSLCDPMDYSPPGSSVHGDSPGKDTGVGCPVLLQRILLTQGSNPSLLHCRQITYHLSHQGNPYTTIIKQITNKDQLTAQGTILNIL